MANLYQKTTMVKGNDDSVQNFRTLSNFVEVIEISNVYQY
jgi:hypothetical protein